jgi:hypothetical protein
MVIRGIVYFGLVFGVGFALGTIRVLWLVPRLGDRAAELLEAPLMLVATVLAAQFVTRRFPASRRLDHLVSGIIALGLLLTVELTVVLGLRGLTINEYFAERDAVAGAVYVIMLLLFAVMPWLIGRRRART